ncbi:hypothetical protein BJX63DRAFT_435476 [Aspergillus granulosus]|uniref:LysM domain-containing protein n=1 Tax=Aspergillus granulosus TaxID=176169 RepID=A0ABR4H129_9EURO
MKPPSSTGNGISTPTPTQSGMVGNCDKFHLVKTDQGCQEIADSYGIPLSRLYAWNPALNGDCTGLWANVYICVRTVGFVPSTTTTRLTSTTTKGNGVATPTSTQPGMVGNW